MVGVVLHVGFEEASGAKLLPTYVARVDGEGHTIRSNDDSSLTLPCLPFLLFLNFGFECTVGSQPISDLQKRCSCSILHLFNGVTDVIVFIIVTVILIVLFYLWMILDGHVDHLVTTNSQSA